MAEARVIHGDMLEVLPTMDADSIDSVVCDPPYDLLSVSRKGSRRINVGEPGNPYTAGARAGGFMGLAWDGTGIAFNPETWRQVYRVLKPGGWLVAMGGTRTYHRLATAIEDAGFEMRDSIAEFYDSSDAASEFLESLTTEQLALLQRAMPGDELAAWVYGCLSEDTEILTDAGWVRYHNASERQKALAFDMESGLLVWQAIRHVYVYDHVGSMVRLHSACTDQLVTENHRVVLSSNHTIVGVPYIASEYDLRSILNGEPQTTGTKAADTAEVLRLRQRVLASTGMDAKYAPTRVQPSMQRQESWGGVGEAWLQGCAGENPRELCSRRDEGGQKPGLEGWGYHFQEARELCGGPLCQGTGLGATHGSQGWVRDGAQAPNGSPVRVLAREDRGNQSREPRSNRQSTGEPDALADEQRSQVVRMGQMSGGYTLPVTAVTVSRVDYAGVVWCISVPSGAFVARRNGKIFITGNSGFPKSMDISKQIDKLAGAERQIIGSGARHNSRSFGNLVGDPDYGAFSGGTPPLTAPTTEEAKHWSGWGTALKPSFEPIVLARKPISAKNVAENVLQHGTGGINIDATRVAAANARPLREVHALRPDVNYQPNSLQGRVDGSLQSSKAVGDTSLGRWPANLVLTHSSECQVVGQSTVEGRVINRFTDGAKPFGGGAGHAYETLKTPPETVTQWQCVPTCPARIMDEQSGNSAGAAAPSPADSPSPPHRNTYGQRKRVEGTFFADEGGASRFFANFNGRSGEASAERRYTDSGSTNFAPLPGARRSDGASPSRFFYSSKASRTERNERVRGEARELRWSSGDQNPGAFQSENTNRSATNFHPTVKPLDLMRWLCRLVTPVGGTVLDCFAGSGSTLVAALQEGFNAVGIEREPDYVSIARQRIDGVQAGFSWEGPSGVVPESSGDAEDDPVPVGEDVVVPEQGVMF